MALAEYQDALAKLLTDASFLNSFLADAETSCTELGLTTRERDSLCAIDRRPLELHAHLLKESRVNFALKVFPVTGRLMHESIHGLIEPFCAAYPPVPYDGAPLVAEARRLREFIGSISVADFGIAEYVPAVLACESAAFEHSIDAGAAADALGFLQANAALDETATAESPLRLYPVCGRHVRIERFEFAVMKIFEAARSGGDVAAAAVRVPTTTLLLKLPGRRRTERLQINDDVRMLIEACDGSLTVAQIVERLQDQAQQRATLDPAIPEKTVTALGQLRAKNILTFRSAARGCAA